MSWNRNRELKKITDRNHVIVDDPKIEYVTMIVDGVPYTHSLKAWIDNLAGPTNSLGAAAAWRIRYLYWIKGWHGSDLAETFECSERTVYRVVDPEQGFYDHVPFPGYDGNGFLPAHEVDKRKYDRRRDKKEYLDRKRQERAEITRLRRAEYARIGGTPLHFIRVKPWRRYDARKYKAAKRARSEAERTANEPGYSQEDRTRRLDPTRADEAIGPEDGQARGQARPDGPRQEDPPRRAEGEVPSRP